MVWLCCRVKFPIYKTAIVNVIILMQIRIYINMVREWSIHKVIDLHLDTSVASAYNVRERYSIGWIRAREWEANQVERIRTKVTKHLIILTIRVPFYFNWITPKTMFRISAHLFDATAMVLMVMMLLWERLLLYSRRIHSRLIILPWLSLSLSLSLGSQDKHSTHFTNVNGIYFRNNNWNG